MKIKYKFGSPCFVNNVPHWSFHLIGNINVSSKTTVGEIFSVIMKEAYYTQNCKKVNIDNDKIKSISYDNACLDYVGIFSYNRMHTLALENRNQNLFKLLKYLKIKKEVRFVLLGGRGATTGINENPYYKIVIHTNENTSHNLPHVLIIHQDGEANYNILNGKLINGTVFRGKIDKSIREYIFKHRSELIKYWNDNSNGIKIDEMTEYYKE